jgi:uncharacterized membrane protein
VTTDPKPATPAASPARGDLRRVLIGAVVGAVLGAMLGFLFDAALSFGVAGTVAGVAIAFVGAIRRDQRVRLANAGPAHDEPRRSKKRKRKH